MNSDGTLDTPRMPVAEHRCQLANALFLLANGFGQVMRGVADTAGPLASFGPTFDEAVDPRRGVMDIDAHRAASLFERYRADYHTTDAAEVLSDPDIDLVYIASNHASHAEYAITAIEAGKAVHIEKPHVVSADQLRRLLAAAAGADDARIRLGFNRPLSPLGQRVR